MNRINRHNGKDLKFTAKFSIDCTMEVQCESCKSYLTIPLHIETERRNGWLEVNWSCKNCNGTFKESLYMNSSVTLLTKSQEKEDSDARWEESFRNNNNYRQMFNGG